MATDKFASLTGILAVAVLILGIVLLVSLQPMQNSQNIISVSGSQEVSVEPDIGKVYIRVVTMNESAQDANEQNQLISNNVRDSIENMAEIESDSFRIQRREKWNPEILESEFVGYETTHVLKATATNVNSIGLIIDTAIDNGAKEIDRIEFDLSQDKQEEYKNQVLGLAVKNAAQKASILAQQLGVELGTVKTISESSFHFTPVSRSIATDEALTTKISPEKITVSASVSINYNIKQQSSY